MPKNGKKRQKRANFGDFLTGPQAWLPDPQSWLAGTHLSVLHDFVPYRGLCPKTIKHVRFQVRIAANSANTGRFNGFGHNWPPFQN